MDERKTPIGMVCKVCGVDKDPYHFFNYSGKYDRKFFVTGWQPGVCWECAAPYRCINCGQIQDADQYRVMGRICKTCKASGMPRPDLKPPHEQGFSESNDFQGVEDGN